MKSIYFAAVLLFLCGVFTAQCAPVLVDVDFNKDASSWKLSGQPGEWSEEGGVDGSGALLISGDGKGSGAWHSPKLDFTPGGVYGIRFKARSERASGGTVTTGTGFCNVDIGVPGTEWREYGFCFVAPPDIREMGYAKFGVWNCSGDFYFDDLEIYAVDPVYNRKEGVLLGDGEVISGESYIFNTNLGGHSRNHSRCLEGFSAGFNSSRWCVGAHSFVDYKHALPSRSLTSMAIKLNCGYYQKGFMRVMVSGDALQWHEVGKVVAVGDVTFEVPKELFPFESIYVRLAGDKKECNLQINGYGVAANFKGAPLNVKGYTYYVEKINQHDSLSVAVTAVDFDAESQRGVVELMFHNIGDKSFGSRVKLRCVNAQREQELEFADKVSLAEGKSVLVLIPFALNAVGEWNLNISAGDNYAACFNLVVPTFFDNSYGDLLPVKGDDLVLWQASSGRKIPRGRALPASKTRRMELALAANEKESIQLVLNSSRALKDVLLTTSEFKRGRDVLPAGAVQIERVGYVPVVQPTDNTGVIADWPDPIFPQDAPCDLKANVNHPYWIRVTLPKGIKSNKYEGYIYVQGEGVSERVKLAIEVYDFELPDRMSCETAFGMSANRIFQYHRVQTIADKRAVVDKYLKCLADNHISPYNPAPLDPWTVEFAGLPAWRGGSFDRENAYKGECSYRVEDNNEKGSVNATYAKNIKFTGKPLKVSFAHRSDKQQRTLFTIRSYRADDTWISGNNRDLWIESSPVWKREEILVKSFHKDAVSFQISIWGAGYHTKDGILGTTWYDDIVISEVDGDKIIFNDGQFEEVDVAANGLSVTFDWDAWDEQMERAFNEFHFNSFRMNVQGLGGGSFMGRYAPSLAGIKEDDPAYRVLMQKYLAGVEQHLKEKGWLEDAYIYWFDEPDPRDYEFVMDGFKKLKEYAPGLRRMLTEQVEPELIGGPNLWCPLTPSLHMEHTEARRAAGDEFWWYVCCSPKAPYVTLFIDHPGAELRLWLWQTWQERVTGILIWETAYWHSPSAYPDSLQNPYADSMGWVSHGEQGERRPWGNGDGRFMYPPLSVFEKDGPVTDGPVPTLRLEMLRDGLEDYEYFVILKKLLAEKRGGLSSRKQAQYKKLLEVPVDVFTSLTEFNIDPSAMESHRVKLARAIEALSR